MIFFRTVVAQEIPPALRSDIAFEEAEPPVYKENLTEKLARDTDNEVTEERTEKKKQELPMVAIIIDDLGYDEALVEELLNFPIELTFSFLPFAPYTRKLERLAYRRGKTVFLHLPLEPKDRKFNPGPGALYLQDSPQTQRDKLAKCLEEVPHAMGVNNHMGSAFTEDRQAMTNIIHELNERSLMFVDSFTTSGSVGLQVARQTAVKSLGRSVFLDNVLDEEKICDRLEQLVLLSEKNGRAVGIGHPHRATVNAVLRCGEKYSNRVQYIGMKEVLL